jgi:hypothetical protein
MLPAAAAAANIGTNQQLQVCALQCALHVAWVAVATPAAVFVPADVDELEGG